MADRICSVCGASNPPDAAFCRVCDTYFDWDGPGDAPKATHDTATSQGGGTTGGTATTTATTSTGPTAEQPTGDETTPRPTTEPRAAVPVALLGQTEVVVTPQAPGTVGIVLKNASDIV